MPQIRIGSDPQPKRSGIQEGPNSSHLCFPFSLLRGKEIIANAAMNPLLLGTIVFLVLGTVATCTVLILYKTKKISRMSAEYFPLKWTDVIELV